ncbi:hypothetical protein COLO4_24289 [Corchorus olitorius]|uniref:Uncharacterized protein n=1 Tax=Corchorus olitorius TaxID=93759 RepID=A0A1R3IBI0_9ROSI|nr:hypothetical protein COLO4_24289 [Corchorus olitorius]
MLKKNISLWSIAKILREQNDIADSLAKAGVSKAN